MKSSTLHRSNLSREKMAMIENIKPQPYRSASSSINQYIKFQKKPELDVLWRDFERNVQSKSTRSKAPIVYAGIGFILGLTFALGIAIIIGLSMYSEIANKSELDTPAYKTTRTTRNSKAPVSIVPSRNSSDSQNSIITSEEKYTIKPGDTLGRVAYRFYGKYDPDRIDEIMKINNIKDMTTLQVGQVLIIPLN